VLKYSVPCALVGCQVVVRWLSGGCQVVVRWLSGGLSGGFPESRIGAL
jgi:hypothetical protein